MTRNSEPEALNFQVPIFGTKTCKSFTDLN